MILCNAMFRNVHSRELDATPEEAGALIDSLASPADRLWPSQRWPSLRMDAGLTAGSSGGHGPIRYSVVGYVPGRELLCRFDPQTGLVGTHRYEVVTARRGTVLRHVVEGAPVGAMRLLWPLAFRWMHDALIEDSLDRAEAALAGSAWRPRPLGAWVRLCRAAA